MSKGGRRGGPPDLKGTLGTLLRTTINQVGAVTDVARKQARTQRQWLDEALLERRRRDALADLGEALYQLIASEEVGLEDLPELARLVEDVQEIDQRIAEAEAAGAPAARMRGGGRPGGGSGGGGGGGGGGDAAGGGRGSGGGRRRDFMGGLAQAARAAGRTAGAASRPADWGRSPRTGGEVGRPGGASQAADPARDPGGGGRRDWGSEPGAAWAEPPEDVRDEPETETGRPGARGAGTEKAPRPARDPRAPVPRPPRGGGGILFVDDDQAPSDVDPDDGLDEYMNEADVPPRD